jgi:hypothetical protein
MSNPLSLYLSTLLILIWSLPAPASQNCDEATQLVIQAYDLGDLAYEKKQLLQLHLAGRVTTLIPLRASMEFTPDQPVIQNRT